MANLLSCLHRTYGANRTHYAQENLFTEYIAFLINRSSGFRRSFTCLFLAEQEAKQFDNAIAATQHRMPTGRPDLVLEVGGRCILVIECKVNAPLEREQLCDYHRWLTDLGRYTNKYLGALTKHRPHERGVTPDDQEFWRGCVSWSHVHSALDAALDRFTPAAWDASARLGNVLESAHFISIGTQFLELLSYKNMTLPAPISPTEDAQLFAHVRRYSRRSEGFRRMLLQALPGNPKQSLTHRCLQEHEFYRQKKGRDQVDTVSGGSVIRIVYEIAPRNYIMFGYWLDRRDDNLRPRNDDHALLQNGDNPICIFAAVHIMRPDPSHAFRMQVVERARDALNAYFQEKSLPRVYIPLVTKRQQLVSILPPENFPVDNMEQRGNPEQKVDAAGKQVDAMADFFDCFTSGLVDTKMPDESQSILEYLTAVAKEK